MRVTNIPLEDRLYLVGPPGIGKTEVVKQKAMQLATFLGKIFVDLREDDSKLDDIIQNPSKYFIYYRIIAVHVFPEDLGIPRVNSDYIEFLPPKVLKILSLNNIEGVLFIDELSNVQRDDQLAMLYSLLQEKEASWIFKMSPNVKIIAAGNPADWSELARELPKPLRNRLIIVPVEPPSLEEWLDYMNRNYGDNWDRFVYAYLKMFPQDFITPPSDDDNFPSPRSWTNLSLKLHKYNDDSLAESFAVGCLGKEVGTRFIAAYMVKISQEDINNVLKNPQVFSRMEQNKQLMLLYSISQQINQNNYNQFLPFLNWLGENSREFLVLVIKLVTDKKLQIKLVLSMKEKMKEILSDIMKYEG
jgi:hypothetical protein